MSFLQSILLLTLIPWVYCEDSVKENNLTTRVNDDGADKQTTSNQAYQPMFNSDSVRPIMVQRYPYLVPDERVYQPYGYKVPPTPMKYPSPWPQPIPWPPKYPPAKPEEEKEDLEKSFLKVMYPAIIIFAIGSIFIPILIIYNYKSIYGLGGGPVGGCGCAKKDGKRQRARLGRLHLISNLINLMVTIEKALAEVERKFSVGTNSQNPSSNSKIKL
ncbi:uncharacterized protein LOC128391222 [Panonychus citri]|uniref:uncharacterized protein LOC128391222 n=1 Tax=Panonychus citri TaxID=50023 RepID=UPI0023080D2A|nr:uncharacterized protein LOC128391222 [Panonychus citri]XP_053207049.1 uncharacterized protein LOC128391222 [Panonychus citri]